MTKREPHTIRKARLRLQDYEARSNLAQALSQDPRFNAILRAHWQAVSQNWHFKAEAERAIIDNWRAYGMD